MTFPKITIDPDILSGHPIIKGTRIPVSLILNLLSHGYSFNRITKEYPELSGNDIKQAIMYAQNRIERENIITT